MHFQYVVLIIILVVLAIILVSAIKKYGGDGFDFNNPSLDNMMILEVLSKLPTVKDVLTQKKVNKRVNTLLSNPSTMQDLKGRWSRYNKCDYDLEKYIEGNKGLGSEDRLIFGDDDAAKVTLESMRRHPKFWSGEDDNNYWISASPTITPAILEAHPMGVNQIRWNKKGLEKNPNMTSEYLESISGLIK